MARFLPSTLMLASILLAPASGLAAACDPGGADAAALRDTWDAMDAACPCEAATSRGQYVACATAVVKGAQAAGTLPSSCRKVARQRARLSVCGRPGSAVCCRTTASGKVKGRIVGDPVRCTAPSGGAACIAGRSNVTEGCTATGCDACGNGVIDPGEDCDPPGVGECPSGCRVPRCGNGIVDPGETCEPPGSAGCTDACTTGTCAAPPAGEIVVACVANGTTSLAVAAGASGYLAAWPGRLNSARDVVRGRRLDATAAPIDALPSTIGDPLLELSDSAPLASGDGGGWYVGWRAFFGPAYWVGGARVDASGAVDGQHTIASGISFGQCSSGEAGPTDLATEGPSQFAVLRTGYAGCAGQFLFFDHPATRVVFAGGAAQQTSLGTPDPIEVPQPTASSGEDAALAHGGGDTVAVLTQAFYDWSSGSPVLVDNAVTAHWLPVPGDSTRLASADSVSGVGIDAAWGGDRFVVVWVSTPGGGPLNSEVRALRFTRTDGPLDPDAGILLAATATVQTAPVVAFDGTAWLVAWVAGPDLGPWNLYGVALLPDGTVVDATPRLLASGVARNRIDLTSRGAGWLLGFTRPAGSGLWSLDVLPVDD